MKKHINVLLAGEAWISTSVHYKGFDNFYSASYETGEFYLKNALQSHEDIRFTHMPSHLIARDFPETMDELRKYDVVIFSDIGSNSFLLPPKVFIEGETRPNRLNLIKEWVSEGGGFLMCGGYMSFSGFGGSAKYYRTAIEEILPVNIYTFDDRVETPQGVKGRSINPDHPILKGIDLEWPSLLGYQELIAKDDATVLAQVDENKPLLAVKQYKKGRTAAWASDIGPHWCPKSFVAWKSFNSLWYNIIKWIASE